MLKKGNEGLKKTSHLRELDRVIQDGVLEGWRLSLCCRSARTCEASTHHLKGPAYLRDTHEEVGHCGKLYMLSQLRQKYRIPSAISVVRKFLSRCVVCRKAKALQQKWQISWRQTSAWWTPFYWHQGWLFWAIWWETRLQHSEKIWSAVNLSHNKSSARWNCTQICKESLEVYTERTVS